MLDVSNFVPENQGYIEYIIKKHERLATITTVYYYINRINNRLAFKIKHWYKLELQESGTMKFLGDAKKIID